MLSRDASVSYVLMTPPTRGDIQRGARAGFTFLTQQAQRDRAKTTRSGENANDDDDDDRDYAPRFALC